jgi:3'-5' exoribonuclease
VGKIFVNQLQRGQAVETTFLVREKTLAKTKAGLPYLSLRLGDRTGEIEGRIWENVQEFSPLFEKDDFIKVRADVDEFQGALQLRISKLRRLDESEVFLEEFLPQTSQDIEAMLKDLKAVCQGVQNPFLRTLLELFLTDESFLAKFKLAPAAKTLHHVYLGGLLEHTHALVQLILLVGPRYRGVNMDLLITGGILHDIGKIDELSFHRSFDYTDAGRLVGHILLTAERVEKKIQEIPDFPEPLAMQLKHILLSHHGEYDFGSPRRPKTLEALLLHHLDDLDAKMNGFWTWIEKEKDLPSRWTSFHRTYDRFIFKPEEVNSD